MKLYAVRWEDGSFSIVGGVDCVQTLWEVADDEASPCNGAQYKRVPEHFLYIRFEQPKYVNYDTVEDEATISTSDDKDAELVLSGGEAGLVGDDRQLERHLQDPKGWRKFPSSCFKRYLQRMAHPDD